MREAELGQASLRTAEELPRSAAVGTADRLIRELESGGAWPAPGLVEQIAGRGEQAVLPLASYIRGALMGLRSRESLPVAIRVLGATRSDIALTALLPLLRECCGEYLEAAADAASQFGPGAAPRLLSIAIDESLPLSNRMAALDAACEAASGSEHASASLCSDLCRMVRSELERGEWITFSGRQWASAVVESAWGLGGDTGAGMSEDEAIGLGIALEEDSCAEPHWRLSVDHSGAWRTRVAFPARYRSEFNMRSLRASSLARARNSGFDDLDDWSAEFSAPG